MNNTRNLLNKKDSTYISLKTELVSVLREHLNLRMQARSGSLKQLHLLKKVRRNIASIKYYLSQKK